MTPIFKRFFKNELLKSVFIAGIMILMFMTAANKFGGDLMLLKNLMLADNITAHCFETRAEGEAASEKTETLFDSQNDSEMNFAANKKGFFVPDVYSYLFRVMDNTVERCMIFGITMVVVFASKAFASERRKNTTSFVGSLPYKKGVIFAEKWLSGIICILVYVGIVYTVSSAWLINMTSQCRFISDELLVENAYNENGMILGIFSEKMLLCLCVMAAFYSVMMFANTLFGKMIYAAVLTPAAAIVGFGGMHGIAHFCKNYDLVWIDNLITDTVSAIFGRLSGNVGLTCFLLVLVSVVFFVFGLLCEKAAKLERVGNVFMFRPVKWILYLFFMFMGAFAFYIFVTHDCGFDSGVLANGVMFVLVGAAAMGLLLSKFLKEV